MKFVFGKLLGGGYRAAIASGLTSDLAAKGVDFLLRLWTVGYCVQRLGTSYGWWLAGFAVVNVASLLELGLGPFLVRETAVLRARGSSLRDWSALFSTVLAAYLAVAVVVLLASWIASPWIVWLVAAGEDIRAELVAALRMGGIYLTLALPLGIWRCFVQGSLKLGTLGLVAIAESGSLAVFTLALLWFWPSIVVLPFAMIGSSVVLSLVSFACTPWEIRRSVWPLQPLDRAVLENLVAFCRPLLCAKVCFLVRERTDEPIAARFLGPGAVVVYMVTQRLVRSGPLMLLGSWTNLSFGPLSEMFASGDIPRIRSAILGGLPWLVLLGGGCAALIWAVNPFFVDFWVGAEYFGGDLLSLLFCSWVMVEVFSRGLGIVLYAAGEQRMMVRAQAWEAALNLVFSLLLVGPLGLVGIALGTALASLASTSWAIPSAVFQLLGIARADLRKSLPFWFLVRVLFLMVGIGLAREMVSGGGNVIRLLVPCLAGAALPPVLFWPELSAWAGYRKVCRVGRAPSGSGEDGFH